MCRLEIDDTDLVHAIIAAYEVGRSLAIGEHESDQTPSLVQAVIAAYETGKQTNVQTVTLESTSTFSGPTASGPAQKAAQAMTPYGQAAIAYSAYCERDAGVDFDSDEWTEPAIAGYGIVRRAIAFELAQKVLPVAPTSSWGDLNELQKVAIIIGRRLKDLDLKFVSLDTYRQVPLRTPEVDSLLFVFRFIRNGDDAAIRWIRAESLSELAYEVQILEFHMPAPTSQEGQPE